MSLKTRVYSNERELATALREGWIDAAQVSSMLLDRLMPQAGAQCESGWSVTLLAEHGRWHESKMKAMFAEQQPVVRLNGQQQEGAS